MSNSSRLTLVKRSVGYLLTLSVAAVLAVWAAHWWPAVCWLLGHGLIAVVLQRLNRPATSEGNKSAYLPALIAGGSLVFFLLLFQYTVSARFGWRPFLHLSDVSSRSWAFLLALFAPALGCWLLGLQQLQQLQIRLPNRSSRMLYLSLSVLLWAVLSWLPFMSTSYLALALSLGTLLFSIDLYLDSNRTSMTWLLIWLLLISLVMASFAFRRSQDLDTQVYKNIAQDIVRQGQVDTTRQYHPDTRWETFSLATAQQRLHATQLAQPPGAGQQWLEGEYRYWLLHRADGQGYVMVGRSAGASRPLLALISLLFLVGLLYCLLLRAVSWLLGYSYESWLLPLFGPSSLRVRIQLSFFGLVLVAFLLVGWFTIGFFQGKPELQNWLEQLLSLYAFLLMMAGALGILLANSITEPIVQIGQKLSNTQLLNNEPLSWPKEDEIGRLVNNYNRMITDLNDSALKLAASEREGAWREMAKQVAHEIKNPLTPMKLQLQQLQRLEKDDPERAREWSKMVAGRMIEQIDGLALIADEFSHFARLPKGKAVSFDLRDLAHSAYELHRVNEQGVLLTLKNSPQVCPVLADRDQLLRVANNLIRNAFQAIEPEKEGEVVLALKQTATSVTLSVHDDGPGIPVDIQSRLFQPNFTTKSSGMGLGLAMCRNIVQQAGGEISFTTEQGRGTVFRVELPLREG